MSVSESVMVPVEMQSKQVGLVITKNKNRIGLLSQAHLPCVILSMRGSKCHTENSSCLIRPCAMLRLSLTHTLSLKHTLSLTLAARRFSVAVCAGSGCSRLVAVSPLAAFQIETGLTPQVGVSCPRAPPFPASWRQGLRCPY